MRNAYLIVALGLLVGACGDDGGSTTTDGGGSNVDADTTPRMVTVSGTAESVTAGGRDPLADVMIEVFQDGNSTPVAMTTTAQDGTFSLTITVQGALRGYLLARLAGQLDTYLYPPGELTEDLADIPVLMLTQGTLEIASTFANGNQEPGDGFLGVQCIDAANMPVAGAMISSTPAGTVRYNGTNGLPSSTATMTHTDGIGYVFKAPPGMLTISATGANTTFMSHPITVRPDVVTLTLIGP